VSVLKIALSPEWVQYVNTTYVERHGELEDDEEVPAKEYLAFFKGLGEAQRNIMEPNLVRRCGLVSLYARRITMRFFLGVNAYMQSIDVKALKHDYLMDSFPGEGEWSQKVMDSSASFMAASSSTGRLTSKDGTKSEGRLMWLAKQCGVDGQGTLTTHGSFLLQFVNLVKTDDEVPKTMKEWKASVQYDSALWPAFERDENHLSKDDYMPSLHLGRCSEIVAAWCKYLKKIAQKSAMVALNEASANEVAQIEGKVIVTEQYASNYDTLSGEIKSGKFLLLICNVNYVTNIIFLYSQ
jgi:hypothetical protein